MPPLLYKNWSSAERNKVFQQIFFNRLKGLAPFAILSLLAACGTPPPETYVERPVEELYNQALADLNNENYREAARGFDEVERQHPYSVWSTKAQLMSAFAYYQSNEYDQAILAAERFIELHPGNKDVAYAYYLIA